MKIPINCPICNNILLNIICQDIFKRDILRKTCRNAKHGQIRFQSVINKEDVEFLSFNYIGNRSKDISTIHWNFNEKDCIMVPKEGFVLELPWFEPDFSHYKKLLNKIKTCILFS